MNQQRRQIILASVGLWATSRASAFPICTDAKNQVCNISQLYSVDASSIVVVKDIADIHRVLKSNHKKISIGGGRYSMGGQTAIKDGVQLDMRSLNQLVWLNAKEKTVRVQAGMRWRDLQTILDPLNLSIRTMQSYANFTVGGSVSVNCHGRYVGHGSIAGSVRSLQLVLPDGQVLEINRQKNTQLFEAAIGGYGAVGIITEVELDLDDNGKILQTAEFVPLMEYPEWFASQIQSNSDVLLHNADLVPPQFNAPFCVTWSRTNKPLTVLDRLTPQNQTYREEQSILWALTELPASDKLRAAIQEKQKEPVVVWRNHEASRDVLELEPATRKLSTYVLQEYFVPVRHLKAYAQNLSKLMQNTATHAINISIRHCKVDPNTLLSWAKEDVFCFVVYYKQRMQQATELDIGRWTRAMIELALQYQGTYYLPYQPHATQAQFEQAYPQINSLRQLRRKLGAHRLSNMMWGRYKV